MINYERMWLTLKGYIQYLETRGVAQIPPVAINHTMDMIYDLEDKEDQLENAGKILTEGFKKGDLK